MDIGWLVRGLPACVGSRALLQRRNERANDGGMVDDGGVCC